MSLPMPLRLGALGGVVGPAMFVGAWAIGAATTNRAYSSLADPISRLAAIGADTRPLMNVGFLGFAAGISLYAAAAAETISTRAGFAALANGVATLAVALLPLDRSAELDRWHGVAAGLGYLSLATIPLLSAGALRRSGHHTLATTAIVAGATSAVCLALTLTDLPTGVLQRAGLTITDLWVVASAIAIATGRIEPAA